MTAGRVLGISLFWLLGVGLHLGQPVLRERAFYGVLMAVALSVGLLAWRRPRLTPLVLIATAALAFGCSSWQACGRWADALPQALENTDIIVTGVVASLPQRNPQGVHFLLNVTQASRGEQLLQIPSKLSLGWFVGGYGRAQLEEDNPALPPIRAGQVWRLPVKLRQPHSQVNPHGFDQELYLFEQGVRATGSVRPKSALPPVQLADFAGYPYQLERWRQQVRDAIEAQVPNRHTSGVLAALSVGDQSAIEHDDWNIFRRTGVAHVMSISGLHITMFAWLATGIIGWAWRRSVRAMLWLPTPHAARWAGVLAAWGYALFSGWGVPAQRTVYMLITVALLQSLGRRWPWPWVLLVAAAVVSALDPWALMQAGFWLSFMAVGLLMASEPAAQAPSSTEPRPLQRGAHALMQALRTQWVTAIGLAPLTLVCFGQISLVGLLANLVAIPLVTLVITPLALLGVMWPKLWSLGAIIEPYFLSMLQWLSTWPASVWSAPAAPWWAQISGLLAASFLLLPWPMRLRALAVPLLIPLLAPQPKPLALGQFELLAVDVGQGTAVLVRTRDHLLVFDAGPQYSPQADAGERILLPLLKARGESRIDRLVLSHRDADHVGGAKALLENVQITDLLSSLESTHPLLALAPTQSRCEAGQAWDWDGVHFEIMQPMAPDYTQHQKPNALSCVLKIATPQASALLTGDMERPQETRLVNTQAALQSDILLVPHHGSKTSSSAAFLDAVQPQVAIIQAGYLNHYGHPVAQVLKRLEERHITIQQTTLCGAWHWRSGEPFAGQCQRQRAKRYWRF